MEPVYTTARSAKMLMGVDDPAERAKRLPVQYREVDNVSDTMHPRRLWRLSG